MRGADFYMIYRFNHLFYLIMLLLLVVTKASKSFFSRKSIIKY